MNQYGYSFTKYYDDDYTEMLPTSFSYAGYAARLLTYQEVFKGCVNSPDDTLLTIDNTCNYLLENTKYSSSTIGIEGYWLETPDESETTRVYEIDPVDYRGASYFASPQSTNNGVRPVIEVKKTDISY